MKTNIKVKTNYIPIRFLPEAEQALKTWLTIHDKEMFSIDDIDKDISNSKWGFYGISPSAGENLITILVKYRDKNLVEDLELNIPKKYINKIDYNKFIVN
jgi:hypothetical protein